MSVSILSLPLTIILFIHAFPVHSELVFCESIDSSRYAEFVACAFIHGLYVVNEQSACEHEQKSDPAISALNGLVLVFEQNDLTALTHGSLTGIPVPVVCTDVWPHVNTCCIDVVKLGSVIYVDNFCGDIIDISNISGGGGGDGVDIFN